MSDESVTLEIEFIAVRRFRKCVTMCGADASLVIKSPDGPQSKLLILETQGETLELSGGITIDTVEVTQISKS